MVSGRIGRGIAAVQSSKGLTNNNKSTRLLCDGQSCPVKNSGNKERTIKRSTYSFR